MQGHKQAYFDIKFFGPFQQGIGGTGKEFIEQGPVVGKGGPEFIGHGEGDVLPFAVGQDVLLFGNPLLGSLEATAAASFGFASLAEKASQASCSNSGERPWRRYHRQASARQRVWSSR
nr:hypothetical protein R10p_00084 [Serratia proteamaculans]